MRKFRTKAKHCVLTSHKHGVYSVAIMSEQTKTDADLIAELGGPAKLAQLLGFDSKYGTQRVHNWITRGIPVRIKYERPDIFGAPKTEQDQAAA
jgi:hypothetical protein